MLATVEVLIMRRCRVRYQGSHFNDLSDKRLSLLCRGARYHAHDAFCFSTLFTSSSIRKKFAHRFVGGQN